MSTNQPANQSTNHSTEFHCTTYGKWILAGEHAVIRGGKALAFPLKSKSFSLSYSPSENPLKAEFAGVFGTEMEMLFWSVIEKATSLIGSSRNDLKGTVKISSEIPIGAGLGASAALCVAVAKWLSHVKGLNGIAIPEFARQLENLFHGESSGVDVMVAYTGEGLLFSRGESPAHFPVNDWPWQPNSFLAISYCGQRGITIEAVQHVKNLIQTNPVLGEQIDLQMKKAVALGIEAIEKKSEEILKSSVLLAADCFQKWGLSEGAVATHMNALQVAGAAAVKPTGSGGGGFMLSFWEQKPSVDVIRQLGLISCF